MQSTNLSIEYSGDDSEIESQPCDDIKISSINIGEYKGYSIVGISPKSHTDITYVFDGNVGLAQSHAKLNLRCESTHKINADVRMVGTELDIDYIPLTSPVLTIKSKILPENLNGEISNPYWNGKKIVSTQPIRCTLNIKYSTSIEYYTNYSSTTTGYIFAACKKTGKVINEIEIPKYNRPEEEKPKILGYKDPILVAQITYRVIIDDSSETVEWAYAEGFPDKYYKNGNRHSIVDISDVADDDKPNTSSCADVEKTYIAWYIEPVVFEDGIRATRNTNARLFTSTLDLPGALRPFGVSSEFRSKFKFKVNARPTDDVDSSGTPIKGMSYWATAAFLYDRTDFDAIYEDYKARFKQFNTGELERE
jgi:hypothetical protein